MDDGWLDDQFDKIVKHTQRTQIQKHSKILRIQQGPQMNQWQPQLCETTYCEVKVNSGIKLHSKSSNTSRRPEMQ